MLIRKKTFEYNTIGGGLHLAEYRKETVTTYSGKTYPKTVLVRRPKCLYIEAKTHAEARHKIAMMIAKGMGMFVEKQLFGAKHTACE